MNVIFLDFDGVLNSTRSAVANLEKENNWITFRQREWAGVDRVAAGLVNRLCIEAPAKVVVSSTWRLNTTAAEFNAEFKRMQCKAIEVIGLTPQLSGPRGNEIKRHLEDNTWINNYVILDDSSDMLSEQMHHFVHINLRNGMLLEHYREALRILNPSHSTLKQFDAPFNNE